MRNAFLSLLAILWNSAFRWVYLFPLCLSLLFFSQLFVRPPQTTIWPFCISFSWEWSWSLPLLQCHQPPSIFLQAFCLSDLIPWIYLSLPVYNHKGFYLHHTWMVWWFRPFRYEIFQRVIQKSSGGYANIPMRITFNVSFCLKHFWMEVVTEKWTH